MAELNDGIFGLFSFFITFACAFLKEFHLKCNESTDTYKRLYFSNQGKSGMAC